MPAPAKRKVIMAVSLLALCSCAGERPNNLGVREGRLTACPASPNCVSSQAADDRHQIAPLVFRDDPEAAFMRLQRILGQRSDTTILTALPDYLRVELRTVLFVDDGEFLLDRAGRTIQVRSASRLGHSDLGKNRRRMEEIRRAFSQEEKRP